MLLKRTITGPLLCGAALTIIVACHREPHHPALSGITVNAGEVTGEIDPNIYSHFIENLGMCIYGGVWEDDPQVPVIHRGIREDVVDMVRRIRPAVVRYPGGTFSDTYHWVDGIGPPPRPIRPNLVWGSLNIIDPRVDPNDPNTFGTDEFMAFVRAVGAEPYIAVNYGSGSPEEAAAWVAYCNATVTDTTVIGTDSAGQHWSTSGYWAQQRAQNGSPEPYGVKYWGIANEIYSWSERGFTDSTSYARRFTEYTGKMKAVDPDIKFVAVGNDNAWNEDVLRIAGNSMDYLSIHAYYPGVTPETILRGVKDTEDNYYSILASPIVLESLVASVGDSIVNVTGSNRVKIALDEWNVWWNLQQLIHSDYSLRDGLFAVLVLNALHRQSSVVGMANLAQMVNAIGMINTSDTNIFATPIYGAFQLVRDHVQELAVSSSVQGDTYENKPFGGIPQVQSVPYLDCSATRDAGNTALTLIVVNRHYTDAIPVEIAVTNFSPHATLEAWELNSASANDRNDYSDKTRVAVKGPLSKKVSSRFMYTFPPHSATALVLKP